MCEHELKGEFHQDSVNFLLVTAVVGLFTGGVKIALAKSCILKSHFTAMFSPYKEIHVTWSKFKQPANYFDPPSK